MGPRTIAAAVVSDHKTVDDVLREHGSWCPVDLPAEAGKPHLLETRFGRSAEEPWLPPFRRTSLLIVRTIAESTLRATYTLKAEVTRADIHFTWEEKVER